MIFNNLIQGQNILFFGIGGGYDIFTSLPIFFEFKDKSKCTFVNFSFTNFKTLDKNYYEKKNNLIKCLEQNPGTNYYFPEGWFKHFLNKKGIDIDIYALEKSGVIQIRDALKQIIQEKNIDTMVLVDGGVDSIMSGTEQNPGTILDDFISLIATKNLNIKKYLVCNGFGTEIEEKLNFSEALINFNNNILSCEFLNSDNPNFMFYKEIYEQSAFKCTKESHIHKKIIQASKGEINNPFMQIWWLFDYEKILQKNKFSDVLENSVSFNDAMNLYLKQKYDIFNYRK